jgi:hypothetical protein
MTSNRLANDHVCTAAEAAVLNFKAEAIEDMPTADEWIAMARSHCVTLRVAGAMLTKSKQELLDMFRKLDEEALVDLVDNLEAANKSFARFHEITRSALARLIVIGSVVELEEEA